MIDLPALEEALLFSASERENNIPLEDDSRDDDDDNDNDNDNEQTLTLVLQSIQSFCLSCRHAVAPYTTATN